MLAVTVHTTGINWDSILAIGTEVVVIVGAVGAVLRRSFRREIKGAVDAAVKREIAPVLDKINARLDVHDTKLARLEGIAEGRRQVVAERGR